jgi:hypothetical protein
MKQGATLVATMTATDKTTLDDDLNAAARTAQDFATSDCRRGILVTRIGYASFVIELSSEVAYGTTREKSFPA